MTLSEYSLLKEQIITNVRSSERYIKLLNTLKNLFTSDINSPRRSEAIASIGQLLEVLEIRDALSEDNLGPLKKIAENLPNRSDILQRIAQYEVTHVPRVCGNYYAVENTQYSPIKELNGGVNLSSPLRTISPKKQQWMIRAVVEEIGNSWRDLARNLKIREGHIDEIDNNHQKIERKSLRVMEIYFQEKADPDNWFFELCEALDNTRRKDLNKSLQEILLKNI